MKRKLFEDCKLKFEHPDWSRNPELGVVATLLETHPELITLAAGDVLKDCTTNNLGRGDSPSVEQIVRAAIYKEMKGLDYRELEYHQSDSRICEHFLKIDPMRPYSFEVFQKYIVKITESTLQTLMLEINKVAISEGLESVEAVRQDSTVIQSNIHYPTNNSLIWDCIGESHRLLSHLKEEVSDLNYRDYTKGAKKTYFKINNTKLDKKKKGAKAEEAEKKVLDKRQKLFAEQLITFTKSINQVANIVKKKDEFSLNTAAKAIIAKLEKLLPVMEQVYQMSVKREILGESVPNSEKIFSIYEQHTDIIVKGSRETQFGHKVDFASGKNNMILYCSILRGNPKDSDLYVPMLDNIEKNYKQIPRDSANDGGYASKKNLEYAQGKGVKNIVFNKIVGSMQNIVSSKNMETRLKKWRSGMEAVISNVKRGFDISRCIWKGWEHFVQKVLWSVIAYNIRVMTRNMVALL
ncbi:DDE transposase [Bacteroidia bacterium]|nr:DDE transposase [Bacteroidia bacterium]